MMGKKESTRMDGAKRFAHNPRKRVAYLLLFLIAVGLCLRVFSVYHLEPTADGSVYSAMGYSFTKNGEFLLPYGETFMRTNYAPAYSHHYPPLYALYLGAFYYAFGFSVLTTQVAALLMSLLFVATLYFTTRNLFGHLNALFVVALMSLEPIFVISTGMNYSENLVGVLFVLTLWAVLKSLKDSRWMLLAGLFASLGYLSKSTVDYFFIISGIGGLLWRFYYDRWAVFKNRAYIGAIFIFGLLAGTWMLRNLYRFGWPNWQTSEYVAFVLGYAGSHPQLLLIGLVAKIILFMAFFVLYAVFFQPELIRSLRKIKMPMESCLIMSVGLLFVLSWFMTAAFWTYEQSGVFWLDNYRYITIAFVPLLWLVIMHKTPIKETTELNEEPPRHAQQPRPSARFSIKGAGRWIVRGMSTEWISFTKRLVTLALVLLIFNVIFFASWTTQIEISAAEKVIKYADSRDIVAIDDMEIYYVYLYIVSKNLTIQVYKEPSNATFILSGNISKIYMNYTRIYTYHGASNPYNLTDASANYTFPESTLMNGDPPHVGLSKTSIAIWQCNTTIGYANTDWLQK